MHHPSWYRPLAGYEGENACEKGKPNEREYVTIAYSGIAFFETWTRVTLEKPCLTTSPETSVLSSSLLF